MKKLINHPEDVVDELVEGFALAYPQIIRKHPSVNAVFRVDAPVAEKVGIVIGGGAGHEPLFLEYVGHGMADAAAHGQVFAAPSPDIILEAIRGVDAGRGVLLLYNNYAGDVLNFDMAQEIARDDGIDVRTVLVNDDLSSAPKGLETERRGTTADHVVIKIAGAAAETGVDLSEVIRITDHAIAGARSLGVALSPCSTPALGRELFDLPDSDMEIGMGLHGEPGVERMPLLTADETVERIIPRIVADLPYLNGDRIVLVINGYGATTRMELFIVNRKVRRMLSEIGIDVIGTEIGEFCTSLEMKGASVTFIKMDDELEELYRSPCRTSTYTVQAP